MYLKCLLLMAASRREANQHQQTPSAPIHFHAEFICKAFELLVLVDGSKSDSTAPLLIRSHQTTSKNQKPKMKPATIQHKTPSCKYSLYS
jgi:hypothetical protein